MAKVDRLPTARQLIESKIKVVQQMKEDYVCKDTGKTFKVAEGTAKYSPFTGSMNIEPVESSASGVREDDYSASYSGFMAANPIPAAAANPFLQEPLIQNPSDEPVSFDWMNAPWAGNPAAPDGSAELGPDDANSLGFVPSKKTPLPPFMVKKPGEAT